MSESRCSNGRSRIGWLAAGIGALSAGIAGYFLYVRPRHLKWGATTREVSGYLPGDALIQDAENVATHAITINASPEDVWPWLAQLGQDKGGFYSYTLFENWVGCEMHNAHEIHPEWQALKEGDVIMFHPKFPPQPVAMLDPGKHFVIGAGMGKDDASTWAFVLRDLGGNQTRLIVRLRARSHRGVGRLGDLIVIEPAHFIMERKMMLTLKVLAEARAAAKNRKA